MKIDLKADRRRQRLLQSDVRAAVWARRRNRAERLHVLRAHWRSFAGMVVISVAVIACVALLVPHGFTRGLFVGAAVSITLGWVAYLVLALSGTVPAGMGATAETWTASELRRLRKHGWFVVNGLPLEGRDIDHVIIGPNGIVVLESKWSAYGWQIDRPSQELMEAVEQGVANARTLRLWRDVHATGADVGVAVCLWGGNRESAPERPSEPRQLRDGVVVSYGLTAIRSWVDSLLADTTRRLASSEVHELWKALDRVVSERERVDASAAPPRSVDWVIWTAVGTALTFIGSLLANLELLLATRSWWLWAVGSLFMLGTGLVISRWRPARYPAIASEAGLAVAVLVVAISGVVVLVH